jgi:hypothetical protein
MIDFVVKYYPRRFAENLIFDFLNQFVYTWIVRKHQNLPNINLKLSLIDDPQGRSQINACYNLGESED